jgi:hypothetical protein
MRPIKQELKMKKLALLLIALMIVSTGCSKSPGRISGVVAWMTQGAGARVVPGITVNVWESDYSYGSGYKKVAYGVTDNNGHYDIINIPPGTYYVTAYQPASTSGTLIAEKSWFIGPVIMPPGGIGRIDMNFENSGYRLPEGLKY